MKVKFHFVFIINKLIGVNLHDFLAHICLEELIEAENGRIRLHNCKKFARFGSRKMLLLALQSVYLSQICICFYEY